MKIEAGTPIQSIKEVGTPIQSFWEHQVGDQIIFKLKWEHQRIASDFFNCMGTPTSTVIELPINCFEAGTPTTVNLDRKRERQSNPNHNRGTGTPTRGVKKWLNIISRLEHKPKPLI